MAAHIDSYRFGSITIDGVRYSKDVIIVGDEVVSPWWRECGGHVFDPRDLNTLLEAEADVVVLGIGAFARVNVPEQTWSVFADIGCELIVDRTAAAVQAYNRAAAAGRKVAAGLHLTC